MVNLWNLSMSITLKEAKARIVALIYIIKSYQYNTYPT